MAKFVGNEAFKSCSNKDHHHTADDCAVCCSKMLERELDKKECSDRCRIEEKHEVDPFANLVKTGWDLFLFSMIGYFLYTLVDSSVQHYLQTLDEKAISDYEQEIGHVAEEEDVKKEKVANVIVKKEKKTPTSTPKSRANTSSAAATPTSTQSRSSRSAKVSAT